MSEVDLKKALPGDVAYFRCGGQWVIKSITSLGGHFDVLFDESVWGNRYCRDGCSSIVNWPHPFDIVKVGE